MSSTLSHRNKQVVWEGINMKNYGKEVIIDLHNCSLENFNRKGITKFFESLCKEIDMQREDLHFWDDLGIPKKEKETEPHLVGTSAIQFIKTSNITIHTLDILKRVYLNVFSCKSFDLQVVVDCCVKYFKGNIVNFQEIKRI